MPCADLWGCGDGCALRALLALTEFVVDQRGQRDDAGAFVGAVGFQRDLGALAGGQHHHAHDGLGVDAPRITGSQTSLWYLAASWVNLAEARACKPSLLIISSSC